MKKEGLATLFEIAASNAFALAPPPGQKQSDSFIAAWGPLKLLLDYLKDPEAYAAAREQDERLKQLFANPPQSMPKARAVRLNPIIFGNIC